MRDFALLLQGLDTESIIGSNIGKVTGARSPKLRDHPNKRSQR